MPNRCRGEAMGCYVRLRESFVRESLADKLGQLTSVNGSCKLAAREDCSPRAQSRNLPPPPHLVIRQPLPIWLEKSGKFSFGVIGTES
jgi:hypothetical protein